MTKKRTETDKPDLPTVVEKKGGVPAEMQMDAGTEIMKSEGQGEIQAAVVLAKRFPRDEEKAKAEILKACDMDEFAETAYYSFPRGKKKNEAGEWVPNIVSGASVRLAREAKRVWTNVRSGFFITHDDDDARGIVTWAWDLEANNRESASDFFKKLVQRKAENGGTTWITADERELRELTFRRNAILERNCLLSLLPSYFVDQCVDICKKTAAGGSKADLKDRIAKMEQHFGTMGISKSSLEKYLKKPLAACTREDLADLRGIAEGIKDGIISPHEREEMFGLAARPPRQEAAPAAADSEKRKGLTMENVTAAQSQSAPHEEKPPPRKAGTTRGRAAAKATDGKGAGPGEEKFDPKESALALIKGATKQNWADIKAAALKMVKEIKGSQNVLDVSTAINEKQRQLLK